MERNGGIFKILCIQGKSLEINKIRKKFLKSRIL